MTYEETILLDAPLAYWRCDELTGLTLGDATANARDLPITMLDFSGGYNPLGHPSGIETDDDSRAFHARFNGLAIGDLENYSYAKTDVGAWWRFAGDFCFEAWIKIEDPPTVVGTTERLLIGNLDHYLGLQYSGVDLDSIWRFAVGVRLPSLVYPFYEAFRAVAEMPIPEAGAYYHVVVFRLFSSIGVYVNSILSALVTIPSLAQTETAASFFIGNSSTNFTHPATIDEVAVYSTALGLGRVQAHYAAGVSGRSMAMIINPPSSLSLDSSDSAPNEVWTARHDWQRPVREELEYGGGVLRGANGNEQAYRHDTAPRRRVSYNTVTIGERNAAKLKSLAWYAGTQQPEVLTPMLTYRDRLADDLPLGSLVVPFDTRWADYDPGCEIMLCSYGGDFDVLDYEVRTVESIADAGLTLTETTEKEWPAGSVVQPARRCHVALPLRVSLTSVKIGSAIAEARVLSKDNPAVRRRATLFAPESELDGIEIFNPFAFRRQDDPRPVNEHLRERDILDTGRGVWLLSQPQDKPEETLSFRFVFLGREEIAQFLGWLDYRWGRTRLLWLPTCRPDFEILSLDVPRTTATVRSVNYARGYGLDEMRTRIVSISQDRTSLTVNTIIGAEDNLDGTESLLLQSAMPASEAFRWRTSFLWLARLDHNVILIDWIRPHIVVAELRFRNIRSSE